MWKRYTCHIHYSFGYLSAFLKQIEIKNKLKHVDRFKTQQIFQINYLLKFPFLIIKSKWSTKYFIKAKSLDDGFLLVSIGKKKEIGATFSLKKLTHKTFFWKTSEPILFTLANTFKVLGLVQVHSQFWNVLYKLQSNIYLGKHLPNIAKFQKQFSLYFQNWTWTWIRPPSSLMWQYIYNVFCFWTCWSWCSQCCLCKSPIPLCQHTRPTSRIVFTYWAIT